MANRIHLGISTCPNDTFAFHGLINKKVDHRGISFEVELLDVQQLNDRLMNGGFDVAKASFHAGLLLAAETVVLPSGSALGFGNGPLLLSRHQDCDPDNFARQRSNGESPAVSDNGTLPVVLCPGETTTATLLYRLFYQKPCEIQQVVFSDIMPQLIQGSADFGVCIHEGRFTWKQNGLFRVSDLGELWFQETAQPLPLGGILARKNLGSEVIHSVQQVIHDSIQYGLKNRDKTLPTMRKFADEFDDDVLMAHVDLYVNEHTIDLGSTGRRALHCLSTMAARVSSIEGYGEISVFE